MSLMLPVVVLLPEQPPAWLQQPVQHTLSTGRPLLLLIGVQPAAPVVATCCDWQQAAPLQALACLQEQALHGSWLPAAAAFARIELMLAAEA